MEEILQKETIGLVFGLISAGLLGVIGALWASLKRQLTEYKTLLNEKQDEKVEELIDQKLEDVTKDIEELRVYVREIGDIEKSHMDLIISSYRFRLVQLCKLYLKQDYMTQDQYDQLTEFYKVYSGLGGNGQVKEYYDRARKLSIIEM